MDAGSEEYHHRHRCGDEDGMDDDDGVEVSSAPSDADEGELADGDPTHPLHLIILQHGLHGKVDDLSYMAQCISTQCPHHLVHVASSNQGKTHDGIDIAGQRLAQETMDVLEEHPSVAEISFIGHSLGGLIARFCMGVLFARGAFERVVPVHYVTFATPHLGSKRNPDGLGRFVHFCATKTLDRTGRQLLLCDRVFRWVEHLRDRGSSIDVGGVQREELIELLCSKGQKKHVEDDVEDGVEDDSNRPSLPFDPLLRFMCDPNGIFIKALLMFKTRTLYANVMDDVTVPFSTASLLPYNPFSCGEMSKSNLSEIYPEVIAPEPRCIHWSPDTIDDDVMVGQYDSGPIDTSHTRRRKSSISPLRPRSLLQRSKSVPPGDPYHKLRLKDGVGKSQESHMVYMLHQLNTNGLTWTRVGVYFGRRNPLVHIHIAGKETIQKKGRPKKGHAVISHLIDTVLSTDGDEDDEEEDDDSDDEDEEEDDDSDDEDEDEDDDDDISKK